MSVELAYSEGIRVTTIAPIFIWKQNKALLFTPICEDRGLKIIAHTPWVWESESLDGALYFM
jgi:hypothetical protein